MAILNGFPPSNTIQCDPARKHVCELCDKDYYCSFTPSLKFNNDINYGLAVCEECFFEDQGRSCWGENWNRPNKWGDSHNIYSKIRNKHSLEEIELMPRSKLIFKLKPQEWLFGSLMAKIIWEITGGWRREWETSTDGTKKQVENLPNDYVVKTGSDSWSKYKTFNLSKSFIETCKDYPKTNIPQSGWSFKIEEVDEIRAWKCLFVFAQ